MSIIKTNSLEIFKENVYTPYEIGMVSNNAYLSIVVTNECQCKCAYCINSHTDRSLELPINKAIDNIKKLSNKYQIKEAILLGGEPTLHSNIFELIKRLRTETNMIIRLTTNGIMLKDKNFIKKLIDKKYGVHGLNISFHGKESFIPITYKDMREIYDYIKEVNSDIKVRVNTNIWKGNLDNFSDIRNYISTTPFICDEIRISNIIPKDGFSVNSINDDSQIHSLTVEEYNSIFQELCDFYSYYHTLIENDKTLGFVKYVLIPSKTPIILNWNTSSTVSQQICENNIREREINTFKCLVNGEISLSWNENNKINL